MRSPSLFWGSTPTSFHRKSLIDLAIAQIQKDEVFKEKFSALNIKEIDIRGKLSDILEKEPCVGIPIDKISDDLREWARTLRFEVKLWLINKYVEFKNQRNIIYEFPEEWKPELDTEEENKGKIKTEPNRYDISISDLFEKGLLKPDEELYMEYKPRTGQKKKFVARLNDNGSLELLGQVYSSPSYAALAGIQEAGSDRKTVNGWTSWRTSKGETLADLREKYLLI